MTTGSLRGIMVDTVQVRSRTLSSISIMLFAGALTDTTPMR